MGESVMYQEIEDTGIRTEMAVTMLKDYPLGIATQFVESLQGLPQHQMIGDPVHTASQQRLIAFLDPDPPVQMFVYDCIDTRAAEDNPQLLFFLPLVQTPG